MPPRPCSNCGRVHDPDEPCAVPLPEEPDDAPGEDKPLEDE